MSATKISELTSHTTTDNTDVVPIVDTLTTTTKKITWSNIKANLKTYFDTLYGAGTVTSVSVTTANGVSGSVATATTTPAITLSLGAITPSSVQVSGLTASELTATDASKNLQSLSVATYPSLTELSYVKGVTSALQTQIDAKYGSGSSPSFATVTTSGGIELGHASDTTISRASAGVASIEGNNIVVNTSSPTLATITTTGNIELGHASDTTLSRVSAGVAAIEGVTIDTISAANTLSNKTLTAPKILDTGYIADDNGNEQIKFSTTASAVNEVTVKNAATGNNPQIQATGGDANVGLDLLPKGTGTVNVKGNSTQAGELRFYEDTDDGTNYSSIRGSARSGNVVYTLPTTDPTAGQVLSATAPSGGISTLSWASAGSTDYSCRVYQTGTTALTTSWVACAFAAEYFDTDTMHDNASNNTRITFTHAGKYMVGGVVSTPNNTVTGARIKLNGSTVLAMQKQGNSGNPEGACVSTIYNFSAADYVELEGYASAVNSSGDSLTNFWAFKIA